jgi:hypothetical protein
LPTGGLVSGLFLPQHLVQKLRFTLRSRSLPVLEDQPGTQQAHWLIPKQGYCENDDTTSPTWFHGRSRSSLFVRGLSTCTWLICNGNRLSSPRRLNVQYLQSWREYKGIKHNHISKQATEITPLPGYFLGLSVQRSRRLIHCNNMLCTITSSIQHVSH